MAESRKVAKIETAGPLPGGIAARAMAARAGGLRYLEDLNPEQRLAVETLDGPVLVLAGAGTGKTRVLTARIAHILSLGRARPGEILAVTFTNKAAREMKNRVAEMVGEIVEGMPWLGTFHAIGVKILRRHAELVGLKPDFTILDTDDQIRLVKQLIEAENLDEKRWPARVFAAMLDGWKNRGLTPAQVPAGEAAAFAGGRGKKLYADYQARLKVLNAVDFGDLLMENIRLFRERPDVLRQYQQRFKFILVDEYQDTNVAQYLWLRLLGQRVPAGAAAPAGGGLTLRDAALRAAPQGEGEGRRDLPAAPQDEGEGRRARKPSPLVGEGGELRAHASNEPGEGESDWPDGESLPPSPASPLRGSAPSPTRGEGTGASGTAPPKNICCVGDDDQSIYGWRGAEVDNILRFEKDFPGATVIRLERNYRSTGHILAAASHLIAHNEGRLGKTLRTEGPAGEKVNVTGAWDSEEEARSIGEEIEELQRAKHTLNEIAILVRASFQMREFEDRFVTLGLPYRVIGGPRFYERAEIRDALAYLRCVMSSSDDLAFERIVNVPRRGLGDATIQVLHDHARARNIPLMDAARAVIETDELKAKPRGSLRDLLAAFERWRTQAAALPHTELAEIVLDESGYTEMWQKDRSADAAGRLENLKELVRSMEEFENLAGFLEHISLVMDRERGEEIDAVNIMTLHSAKGLEFDTVFLPGWEEGLFPHQRSLDEQGHAGLEEERRLAHVGLTRARKRAKIYFATNRRIHGLWSGTVPSRFLDELPEAHVEVTESKGGFNFAGYGSSRFDTMTAFDSSYGTPGWQRARARGRGRNQESPPPLRGRAREGGHFDDGFAEDAAGYDADAPSHLSPSGRGRPREARSGEGDRASRHREGGPPSPRPSPRRGEGDVSRRRRPPLTIEGELVAKSTGASHFRVGDRVFHLKFGNGNVTAIDGNKLTILFDKAGEKRVVDSYVERV